MNQFTAKHAPHITGVLSGFDRVLFRGTLMGIHFPEGMGKFLSSWNVLVKDFKSYVLKVSDRVKDAAADRMEALDRPVVFMDSPNESKEDRARQIARDLGITQGPICVLSCVEGCHTFRVRHEYGNGDPVLKMERAKCLHLYFYSVHPVLGFMHARLQTWFPFSLQVCINGREWLARQMDRDGARYTRQRNCFVAIEDFEKAQALLDAQLKTDWPKLLGDIAAEVHPLKKALFANYDTDYYWSTWSTEWATDIVFSEPAYLKSLYSRLVRHSMDALGSGDVLRFLSHKVRKDGEVPNTFQGEIATDLKIRPEGVRVKHTVNGNSVKVYDKAYTNEGSVLRVETTINREKDIKAYRPLQGDPEGPQQWRPLRRGIADMHRRAQVSHASNERYLNALASVDERATLGEIIDTITRPAEWNGRRVRALRPFDADDMALFAAVSRGEFTLNGLRNRDLQGLLYRGDPADEKDARRRSGCVSRKLRMLRAHGILTKVQGTHRYQVTKNGRRLLTALLTARQTRVDALLDRAA